MAIVLFLGANVKEYGEKSDGYIETLFSEGRIRCECCARPMKRHSSYARGIRETGQTIKITIAGCRGCDIYHALLPDFLSPHKQYSADEIEGVMIDSQTMPTIQIETAASESTVRRWIAQIGGRIVGAVSILKHLFAKAGRAVSEIAIDPGGGAYSELEQMLAMAPMPARTSGNKLGLANIWLGSHDRKALI
jgi:hypothetical protein